MSDRLETLLDSLGAGAASTRPAPEFLRAVARRRRQRRLKQVGAAAALLLLGVSAWVTVGPRLTRPRPLDGPRIAGPRPGPPQVSNVSLVALNQANRTLDPDHLNLPISSTPGYAESLRLGTRCDSASFERWLWQ